MRRVTLRGLRARKLRTALTAFAIVLGVAMVTGSSVLGATMKRSFDIVFSSAYQQTDVVVSGKPVVDWSESSAPTLPTSTLEQIRAVPGVERAAGAIFDFSGNSPSAIVIGPKGKKISGDPSFVMGFAPRDEQFNPLRLREGRWAARDGEVVLDASTADGHGVKIGDTVKIAALTPSAPFKVVGLGRFGKVSSLGGATMAVFDLPVAQRLLHQESSRPPRSRPRFPGSCHRSPSGPPQSSPRQRGAPAVLARTNARTSAQAASLASENSAAFRSKKLCGAPG